MKICVAQTRPAKGDIEKNLEQHLKLVDMSLAYGTDLIIFPELSITGYEPELAHDLAITHDDPRFDKLQTISDTADISIGIGAPVKTANGTGIGMVIFQPGLPRFTYHKKYLHDSEIPFFVSGENSTITIGEQPGISPAICYEMSVPAHAENAFRHGATIYIASAVESITGIEKAYTRLARIAKQYGMTVLLSNCIGRTGIYDCPGGSAAWNNKGELVGQLDDEHEGLLIVNTDTHEVTDVTIFQYLEKSS
jgi:predicted amidohydrolase